MASNFDVSRGVYYKHEIQSNIYEIFSEIFKK